MSETREQGGAVATSERGAAPLLYEVYNSRGEVIGEATGEALRKIGVELPAEEFVADGQPALKAILCRPLLRSGWREPREKFGFQSVKVNGEWVPKETRRPEPLVNPTKNSGHLVPCLCCENPRQVDSTTKSVIDHFVSGLKR